MDPVSHFIPDPQQKLNHSLLELPFLTLFPQEVNQVTAAYLQHIVVELQVLFDLEVSKWTVSSLFQTATNAQV